jgi:hypothetical protein
MAKSLLIGVLVAVIALAVVVAVYFGWRVVTGGPNGDITQEKIQYYDEQQKKLQAHKPTSPQEAAKAGAPMGAMPAAPPAGAPPGPR